MCMLSQEVIYPGSHSQLTPILASIETSLLNTLLNPRTQAPASRRWSSLLVIPDRPVFFFDIRDLVGTHVDV